MKKIKTILLMVSFFLLFLASSVSAEESQISVYRVYNPLTQEHLYSPNRTEVDSLKEAGWTEEGIGWRCQNNGEAVYRLYHPITTDHLYTSDVNEKETLCANYSWVADFGGDPIFYSNGPLPVYRLLDQSTGKHYLTSDGSEYESLAAIGWTPEGQKLSCQSGTIQYSDPEAVRDRILSLQSYYPEGTPWGSTNFYISRSKLSNIAGFGSQAFALLCSDYGFDDHPVREHNDASDIRLGDIIQTVNGTVNVVVTDVNGSDVTVVEGDYNGTVHWGRKISRNALWGSTILTRY